MNNTISNRKIHNKLCNSSVIACCHVAVMWNNGMIHDFFVYRRVGKFGEVCKWTLKVCSFKGCLYKIVCIRRVKRRMSILERCVLETCGDQGRLCVLERFSYREISAQKRWTTTFSWGIFFTFSAKNRDSLSQKVCIYYTC